MARKLHKHRIHNVKINFADCPLIFLGGLQAIVANPAHMLAEISELKLRSGQTSNFVPNANMNPATIPKDIVVKFGDVGMYRRFGGNNPSKGFCTTNETQGAAIGLNSMYYTENSQLASLEGTFAEEVFHALGFTGHPPDGTHSILSVKGAGLGNVGSMMFTAFDRQTIADAYTPGRINLCSQLTFHDRFRLNVPYVRYGGYSYSLLLTHIKDYFALKLTLLDIDLSGYEFLHEPNAEISNKGLVITIPRLRLGNVIAEAVFLLNSGTKATLQHFKILQNA